MTLSEIRDLSDENGRKWKKTEENRRKRTETYVNGERQFYLPYLCIGFEKEPRRFRIIQE